MSRSVKKNRKTGKLLKYKEYQYVSSHCQHHNACSYCRENRTFSTERRKPLIESE